MVGVIASHGKLTLPIRPELPEGWIPHVPPGVVRIVEWDRTAITIQSLSGMPIPYYIAFVRGETVAAMFQAGQAFKSGMAAIRTLAGKKK